MITKVLVIAARMLAAWDRFWFEARSTRQIAAFRGVLGALLFAFYVSRSFDLDLFYTNGGVLDQGAIAELMDMHYRFSLFDWLGSSTAVAITLHSLHLVSLLALAFGWVPRLSAILAFVLQLSFVHRNVAVAYGADLIATVFLFYLALADHRRIQPRKPDLRSMLGSAAFRLMQIQICVIYGYSGIEKAKGITWWRGDALWTVLANPQLARFDFTWLASFPLLMTILTTTVFFWEIYFPALIWTRRLRLPALLFGAMMHLGIAFTMHIPFFGLLMIATYVTFLTPAEIKSVQRFFGLRAKFLKVGRPTTEESCV